jgi:hypothetical protein
MQINHKIITFRSKKRKKKKKKNLKTASNVKQFLIASLDNHFLKTDYKKVIFILVKKHKVALLF